MTLAVDAFIQLLGRHGWARDKSFEDACSRESKRTDISAFKKRVYGVWVRIFMFDDWLTVNATISSTTTPPSASHDEYGKRNMRYIAVSSTIDHVEQVANEVANVYLSYGRRHEDVSGYSYRGRRGQDAVDAWKKDVESTILEILETTRSTRPRQIRATPSSTSSIISNLLDNYSMALSTSRAKQSAMIRTILDSMARRKLIVLLTGHNNESEWSID